ncbi:MAG: hypothetical protein DFNUSKGM_000975, partial [Candidatus Fervidibacter sacchari]
MRAKGLTTLAGMLSVLTICGVVVFVGAAKGQWAKQVAVSNEKIRLTVEWTDNGYGAANLFVRYRQRWVPTARWQPLTRIIYGRKDGEIDWMPSLRQATVQRNRLLVFDKLTAPDGSEWEVKLTVSLAPTEPVAKVRCEWQCNSDRQLKALWGPNLLVGEGTEKLWGLLPGVEFL